MATLGPFQLFEPLAEGGMGVVWRAMHVGQRVPVALKIIDTVDDRARAAFRDEVQAVAGLHHPGIVLVFDHGEVPPDFDGIEGVPPGASFLAMEYASFGSLKSRTGAMPWSQIRSTLLALLDALAHAHARGVVHRDLKPGNILLAGPEDVRPGLKIADFGLARALDRTDELESVTGTPLYMAPEQITRRWRDFGPWTDLYALGIVAWELATGRAPFHGLSLPGIVNGHITGELPPFRPRVAVPARFHSWLLRMMQTDPADRYPRCADAAWELAQLGQPEGDAAEEPVFQAVLSNPTLTLDDTLLMLASGEVSHLDLPEPTVEPSPRDADAFPTPVEPPPIPPSWSRPTPFEAPLQLLGVGLGLFGLRTVPLVGRVHERDHVWEALHEVYSLGETRMVCLRGAAGNGKSRLASWICERAHEVGAARLVKVVHSPDPTPVDGIGPGLARRFRCVGLEAVDVHERLSSLRMYGVDVEALVALMRPEDGTAVQLATPEERYEVARQALADLSETRPVVLWIDDAHWGADALALTSYLMDRPLPVLVLLTVQEEALAERDAERAQLEQLLEAPGARAVPVDALDPDDSRELVRVLLGLEGTLADRLAERTQGNPLFTVQLVGDWVARGILVPGRTGFELQEGADIELPDDLHEVWAKRLERVLMVRPEARPALEIGAAMGQEVDAVEWRGICAHAGVPIPTQLVETLIEGRLANATDEGWSFAHGMLRESVARLAREDDSWARANRRCAAALEQSRPTPHARLARHHFAAGDWEAAAAHVAAALQAGFDVYIDRRTNRALLELYEQTLRRMGLPDEDPRWGELWLARTAYWLEAEEPDRALRDAQRTATSARRYRWKRLSARAELAVARVARSRGDVIRATGLFDRAVRSIERSGVDSLLPSALIQCAHTHIMAGELDQAEPPLARARALCEAGGDIRRLARVVRFEGDIARLRREYEKARQCFRDATRMNQESGLRSNASSSLHGVAEMERLLGNLDEAEAIYRKVVELDLVRGDPSEVPRLNLSLCLLAREKFAEARSELERLAEGWKAAHRPGYVAVAHVTLVQATAGLGDWDAYDHHIDEGTRLCHQTGMVDIDVALCCETAGELAARAGHADRALRAWELALQNWEQLHDDDRAAELVERMRAL